MKAATKRVLAFAGGGGVLGAFTVIGAAAGILGGLVLGSVVEIARRSRGSSFGFGADSVQGAATIEEARYAKNDLKRRVFAQGADVPWWLVGVGIGGHDANWFVLVSVAPGVPTEILQRLPTSSQGVPVVVDASGTQSLEMSTGL